MDLENAIMPTPEQFEYLASSTDPRPIVAVNLLKFKPRAVYADGRQSDLSGLEAFAVYSRAMKDIVESFGGTFLISVRVDRLVIGGGVADWDRIALVRYPSRAVFAQVMRAPVVQEAAVHRHAALDGQLNIVTQLENEGDPRWAAFFETAAA